MRIGKVIERSRDAGVLPPNMPKRTKKIKCALIGAVPAAVVLGAVLTGTKKAAKPEDSKAASDARI